MLIAATAAAALLLAAALWLHAGGGPAVAVVSGAQGEIVRVRLDGENEGRDLPVSEHVTLRVEPGRICFTQSDCPDGLCVKSGWLSRPGETAVCLPERITIRVIGEGDMDEVAY